MILHQLQFGIGFKFPEIWFSDRNLQSLARVSSSGLSSFDVLPETDLRAHFLHQTYGMSPRPFSRRLLQKNRMHQGTLTYACTSTLSMARLNKVFTKMFVASQFAERRRQDGSVWAPGNKVDEEKRGNNTARSRHFILAPVFRYDTIMFSRESACSVHTLERCSKIF